MQPASSQTSDSILKPVDGMTKPRRLKGHKSTVTCCIASRTRPGLIATSGEGMKIFCMLVQGQKSFLSTFICYCTLGVSSWRPLERYNYNKEEINQISCSTKSSFLAAADDNGDIKIIDIRQHCLYKTLRSGHTSICSSVQFLPWRPWEGNRSKKRSNKCYRNWQVLTVIHERSSEASQ